MYSIVVITDWSYFEVIIGDTNITSIILWIQSSSAAPAGCWGKGIEPPPRYSRSPFSRSCSS